MYLDFEFDDEDGTWTATLNFEIEDHFGLDKRDALVYQGWHQGFAAWWALQHLKGYVPFHTRVRSVFQVSGDITP